jgi:hypothetical protein
MDRRDRKRDQRKGRGATDCRGPGVIVRIVSDVSVKKEGPLIATDLEFPATKFLFYPRHRALMEGVDDHEKSTYALADQSMPAGHSNAPVLSW